MSEGFCTNTISDKDETIDDTHLHDGKTWFDMRTEMILVPARESWAPIKAWIIKMCHKSGTCDKEIGGWDKKLDNIDQKVSPKLGNPPTP